MLLYNVSEESEIANWYANKQVLITGGTGFLGKVLIEKLLRSCPALKKIYVIVRAKKNVAPKNRLSSIFELPLFDKIRKENPDIFQKVVAIQGDSQQKQFGINPTDRAVLIQNVNIIFHGAASVKFDEPLNIAVPINIIATRDLLDLSCEMKDLKAFVYVSTAYSNSNQMEIKEKLYPIPISPTKLIDFVESIDTNVLNSITPSLLQDWPNTYTFTKSLTEHLVHEYSEKLPLTILRPSIVGCCASEPISGWIDCLHGVTGILWAGASGILRIVNINTNLRTDVIPADYTVNALITIAWNVDNRKSKDLKLYNCAIGTVNPLTNNDINRLMKKYVYIYPTIDIPWLPHVIHVTNFQLYSIGSFLLHTFPAYLADFVKMISGRRQFYVNFLTKISTGSKALEYFFSKEWEFETSNLENLTLSLSEVDKHMFNFDIKTINWDNYMKNYVIGIRQYLFKDNLDTLPTARKKLKIMKITYFTMKCIFIILLFYILFKNIFSILSF